jgi:uncharacterized protein (DUF4415 family)
MKIKQSDIEKMLRAKNHVVSARIDAVMVEKIKHFGMTPQTAIVAALQTFLGIKDSDYSDFVIDQD